jgi:1-acyl-sn-glycerol-3-phosphate acyltransferase
VADPASPAPPPNVKVPRSPLLRWVLDPLTTVFGWAVLLVFGPFRVIDRWRLPRSGGVLVVANHRSDVDPILIQGACRRHVHFMAKSELFDMPSIAWFMRFWGAFPVRRGEPDRASLKLAITLLKDGHVVCIFPEGQLSSTGEMLPILPGVALIARQAEVPLVAVGLTGAAKILPYGTLIPRPAFAWVTARLGNPRVVSRNDSNEELTAWIDAELRRLIV